MMPFDWPFCGGILTLPARAWRGSGRFEDEVICAVFFFRCGEARAAAALTEDKWEGIPRPSAVERPALVHRLGTRTERGIRGEYVQGRRAKGRQSASGPAAAWRCGMGCGCSRWRPRRAWNADVVVRREQPSTRALDNRVGGNLASGHTDWPDAAKREASRLEAGETDR